ncbi:UNVERIFIED_ORG: hypothetical protein GGE64_006237 [Rhizobium etli]|nr:hypothetical protein [Rhizobium leguminosarum]
MSTHPFIVTPNLITPPHPAVSSTGEKPLTGIDIPKLFQGLIMATSE